MTISPYVIPGIPPAVETDMEIDKVCKAMQINKSWILSSCRKTEYVKVRCMITAILRNRGITIMAIGDALNRHHATIIHLTRTHRDMIKTDEIYRNNFSGVLNFINYGIEFTPQRKAPKSRNETKEHRYIMKNVIKKWVRDSKVYDFMELNEPDFNIAMCTIGLMQRSTLKYNTFKFRTARTGDGMRKIIRTC